MTELVIEADRIERQYWRDLWNYRELFLFFCWRDLLVRYKQTVVGVSWSIIRPLVTMLVLTVVFGKLGKLPTGGLPYPLLVFCGMLPWQFFSSAMSDSGNSLVNNANMISKIYFPRLVITISSVMTSFVDFLVSAVFLAILMGWYKFPPSTNIVFLPLFRCFSVSVHPSALEYGSPLSWLNTEIFASLCRSWCSLGSIFRRSDFRAAWFPRAIDLSIP